MKRLILSFFLILFILSSKVFAQRCAHDVMHQQDQINNPELYKQKEAFKMSLSKMVQDKKMKLTAVEEIFTIPVVVHVVHNNGAGTIGGSNNPNITDAQVFSQVQILNEDYRKMVGTNGYNSDPLAADVKIEFCMASLSPSGTPTNGINRIYNSKSSWSTSDEYQLKSTSYWPSDQYLNIWVAKLNGGVLGYAPYPSGTPFTEISGGAATLDGVVIDFRAFGNTGAVQSPYNLGRTTTHEVGHWLGLIHLWGDDPNNGCLPDYVADTPDDSGPNLDLDCLDSSNCSSPVVYIQDLTNDYMDYSTDICMNLFTTGQKDRMRTVMQTAPSRIALKNSYGCCASGILASVPLQEGFETDDYLANGWWIDNPDGDSTWDRTTPGAYDLSSASIYMINDSANLGELDYLVTPFIRFTGEEPFLEFDLAYAADPFVSTSDTLVISYNVNCRDWYTLASYYGPDLLTTTASTAGFVPVSDDWKRMRVDLDVLNNKPLGRLRFENRSGTRNNLYLDNVNIYKTSDNLQVRPYPNPATDILNIEVVFSGIQDVTYEMYDLIGQQVFKVTDPHRVSHIKTLDVSGVTRGMYIIKVTVNGQSVTKKVLINY